MDTIIKTVLPPVLSLFAPGAAFYMFWYPATSPAWLRGLFTLLTFLIAIAALVTAIQSGDEDYRKKQYKKWRKQFFKRGTQMSPLRALMFWSTILFLFLGNNIFHGISWTFLFGASIVNRALYINMYNEEMRNSPNMKDLAEVKEEA